MSLSRSLPDPKRQGETSLEWALDHRKSVRAFLEEELSEEETGQLLWACAGVNAYGKRTAPSAGARYPLEVYTVTSRGVEHYDPTGHLLRKHTASDVRKALAEASWGQDFVRHAPLTLVLCAVMERVQSRYGAERGLRYVLMEVGHAAQNVLLQAVALGLGAVPVGAFGDDPVQELLELPTDHLPLYLLPIGRPAKRSQTAEEGVP
jgi:SagB-type dehydrogenase family enzyme